MILDFSITNFKSINETQTLSFEATPDEHLDDYFVIQKDKYRILKLAAILGANASGKSNVLKAFQMLRQLILKPCDNKTDKIGTDSFALDDRCKDIDTGLKINFLCNESKFCYEVRFNDRLISYESLTAQPFGKLRPHVVFTRTTDTSEMVSTLKLGAKYRSAKITESLTTNLLHNRTVFGAFLHSNVNVTWLKDLITWTDQYLLPNITTDEQNLQRYVASLIDQEKIRKEDVAELLKHADIGVCDFDLEKKEEQLPADLVEAILNDNNAPTGLKERLKEHPVGINFKVSMKHSGVNCQKTFEFEKESSGTQRYFELSGILLQLIRQSHFVAIDELENKLHPDLYMHFVMTYLTNTQNSQLIFTTHIREFLEDRDTFRDDSIWFTQKSMDGSTELYSLADFGSDVLRNSTNRSNAYRSGKLGAIPNLLGTYITNYDVQRA